MIVGVYIYDGVELLDATGPLQVFTTAMRFTDSITSVVVIAEHLQPIRCRGGVVIHPDTDINGGLACDVLIVPGGVHEPMLQRTSVLEWLRIQYCGACITASVCTGVFLLAEAGIVTTERVTTHWEDINSLRQCYNQLCVVDECLWVDSGKVVTSAGITSGLAMSLYLVKRLSNRAVAELTAKQMQYAYPESNRL